MFGRYIPFHQKSLIQHGLPHDNDLIGVTPLPQQLLQTAAVGTLVGIVDVIAGDKPQTYQPKALNYSFSTLPPSFFSLNRRGN